MKKLLDPEKYARCARRCAAEGIVLLKNDREALPLPGGSRIALFGRCQDHYFKSGTGSGGMVNSRYVIGVKEALEKDGRFALDEELKEVYAGWSREHPYNPGSGWASEPWYQEEMPVTREFARSVAERCDTALVLIGRTAGEDRDNSREKGSWLLTDEEEAMLDAVTAAFPQTVVLLNTGNIMDMTWVKRYDPAAVLLIWQGGQEGGNGVLDVLSGDVCPSGHLTDTIAENVEDYPSDANFGSRVCNVQREDIYIGYRYFETFAKERVLYPFGYGLSYTGFSVRTEKFEQAGKDVCITARVQNIGTCPGQELVQVYLEAPQGRLGKPLRTLVGFAKTPELCPGESANVVISVSETQMASYDETGSCGIRSAWVMESGNYVFHIGENVRCTEEAGRFHLAEDRIVCRQKERLAPTRAFSRMVPAPDGKGGFKVTCEDVPTAGRSAQKERERNLPPEIPRTGDRGIRLRDVAEGKADMESFIAQLSDEDLCCIVRGEGMSSPKVTPGCGGAFGGVTDRLLHFGIPIACVSDGPSGIRMDSGKQAFSLPNGTCLASTWNEALVEELYAWEGLELRKNRIDVLLGPGMNLHRHPLNGRNFEYFSEDPLVTGRCGAAVLRGLHRNGVTGTIKHFAMNTQETARHTVEHVVSERAARELYLRGFEIAVKEGGAQAVMTTYGPVNGFYTSSNYDLVTGILREEWGFRGIVMTDWWSKGNDEGQPGDVRNMAAMIRAQNDLNMVTACAADNTNEDNSMRALAAGNVTRGEYQRSAMNICRFILTKPVFARAEGIDDELDRELEQEPDEEASFFASMIDCRIDRSGHAEIEPERIDTAGGKSTLISVAVRERGIYTLKLTLRAKGQSTLAQIPMSIFMDKQLVKQVTLTGADRDWLCIEVRLPPCFSTMFIRVYFAQAGIEIGSAAISLTESLEEKIRETR